MASFWDFMTGTTPAGAAASTAKAVTDGLFSGVDKIIRDFKAPPEAVLQLETLKAQIEAQITNAQMQDMQSARAMQITSGSKMPAILTLFYTVSSSQGALKTDTINTLVNSKTTPAP